MTDTLSNMTTEMNNISAQIITQEEEITGLRTDLAATNAACESHEKDLADVEKFKIRSDMRIKVLEGKTKTPRYCYCRYEETIVCHIC